MNFWGGYNIRAGHAKDSIHNSAVTMEKRFTPQGFSPSDDQEDEGNLIIKNLLRHNRRVKAILGGNDKTPNRDGYIELRNGQHSVGMLDVQVKPIDSTRKKKNGKICYQLPGSLVGYASFSGRPFLLICYDRDSDKAYWKQVTESLFDRSKGDQRSITVEFAVDDEITDAKPFTDEWFELFNRHLTSLNLAKKMQDLAEILSSKGIGSRLDTPEALAELLEKMEQLSSDKFKTRLEEAQKLFNQSEIQAASLILEPLIGELIAENESAELIFDVYIWLGNCRYRSEQFFEAEHCFRKAIEIDRNSPRAQTNLAHILYVKCEKKDEALALAKAGYEQRPEHEASLATYIMCLNFAKKFDEADKLITNHQLAFDKSSTLQLALGQIYKERGLFQDSREHFQKAFSIDGNNQHALILIAESTYKLVRASGLARLANGSVPDVETFAEALDDSIVGLTTAISHFTKTGDKQALFRAYDHRACINMLRGRFEDSLADCLKMEAVLANHIITNILTAQINLQLGNFDKVIDSLEPLANDGRSDVLQSLAYAHYRQDEWANAANYYDKYIDWENDSNAEVLSYIQCLWACDRKKKAYQLARNMRLKGRAPIEIMKQVELARLLEMSEWRAAIEVIEDLIKASPQDSEFYIERICMHVELQNRDTAISLLKEFPSHTLTSDSWGQETFNKMVANLKRIGWI